MRIFSPLWGYPYRHYFEEGCLKSFKWPRNAAVVDNAEWVFVGKENLPYYGGRTLTPSHEGVTDLMQWGLIEVIKMSLRDKEPVFLCTSDYVFSEGTMEVVRELGRVPGTCVAFPHVRVNPSFLMEDLSKPISGARMVSLAWKHLHRSWVSAEITQPFANSFFSGVSWQRIGEEIFVQHRLPTAFLVNFTREDLDFFSCHKFGAWDHRWPATWVNRQRYIGSSDGAFCVEITDPNTHAGPVREVNSLEPDAYQGELSHHKRNREFVSVFRMSET